MYAPLLRPPQEPHLAPVRLQLFIQLFVGLLFG